MASFPDELIGEEVFIVHSTNKSEIGLTGKIVDETKNTLTIDDHGKHKTILKQNVTVKIIRTGMVVEGKTIARRSEDRIKGK